MGKVGPPRTGAADLDEHARAMLVTISHTPDVTADTAEERRSANRLVLLGYAKRISDTGQPVKIRITPTGREKLGRKAS